MPFFGSIDRKLSAHRQIGGESGFFGNLSVSTLIKQVVSGIVKFTGGLEARSPFRRISLGGVISFTGRLLSSGGDLVAGLFTPLFKPLFRSIFKDRK